MEHENEETAMVMVRMPRGVYDKLPDTQDVTLEKLAAAIVKTKGKPFTTALFEMQPDPDTEKWREACQKSGEAFLLDIKSGRGKVNEIAVNLAEERATAALLAVQKARRV